MARTRGRAPATRGVYAIEDAGLLLPEAVALDTSFVVHALIESQSLHGPCSTFLERLVAEEVTVVVSELLEVELAEVTFRIALAERWGRAWRRHRTDGRVRRRGRRLLDDVQSRYRLLLDAVTEAPIPLAPVAGSAATLMADYGIASYDAVHAATAVAAGAEAIVTTDDASGPASIELGKDPELAQRDHVLLTTERGGHSSEVTRTCATSRCSPVSSLPTDRMLWSFVVEPGGLVWPDPGEDRPHLKEALQNCVPSLSPCRDHAEAFDGLDRPRP